MNTIVLIKALNPSAARSIIEMYENKGVRVSYVIPLIFHYPKDAMQFNAVEPSIKGIISLLSRPKFCEHALHYQPERSSLIPLFNIPDGNNRYGQEDV